MSGSGEAGLRGKYLDWCSARIAERFLDLTPEEIYELAWPEEEAAGPHPSRLSPGQDDYLTLVRRATDALWDRLSLPAYEEWSRAYREDPDAYDRDMVGFWRTVSGPSDR
ncbi:MAG TPA: hypothetical protein VK966_07390 [Longimicrobiales bacterium]|nr:hypothetical protein [Longimicrobiales bacterium]